VRYGGTKPGATTELSGGVLALYTSCGNRCSVSYEVTAPAGVRVSGHNGSGALDLSGVSTVSVDVGSGAVTVRHASGNVNARTGSGAIRLDDVHGSVVAHADSGAIRLTGIDGSVAATTGSGAISVQLAGADDVTAHTGSGTVQVSVPSGSRYRVAATSDSGHVDVGIATDPGADHALDVRTQSGSITVR